MRKQIAMFAVAAMLVGTVAGCGNNGNDKTTSGSTAAPETTTEATGQNVNEGNTTTASRGDTYEKKVSYLKNYFGIEASADFTADTLSEAITKVTDQELEKLTGINGLAVMKQAVAAANYDELAVSYKEDKTKSRLEAYGLEVPAENGNYLAAALDAGLIDSASAKAFAENKDVTKEQAVELLMQIADSNGYGRNYLGYSDDENIDAKVNNLWNSFIIYDDKALSEIGRKAVEQKVVTGFNLKNHSFDANFLPELTLQYGHSDIKHAHQLLALLKSEDIRAKVQLEPKISIYQYMLEWGPVPEATPTYEVKKFSDDLYLVYAVEYDLMLEFDSREEMDKFDSVIEAYAKKYDENAEDLTGLIYAPWWQPLYSTTVADMDKERYPEIKNFKVENGMYALQSFCLPDDAKKVDDSFKKFSSELKGDQKVEMEEETRYVDIAFYRYLGGGYE